MEQSTLKTLRLLIPGLISIGVFLIFFSVWKKKEVYDLKIIDYTYITIIALVLGAMYYLLEIRQLVTSFSHKRIDLNIKNNVVQLYNRSLSNSEAQFLHQGNRLKNIFYKIIDNEESLKRKGSLVYFNGLLWTSTADLFVISGFGSLAFLLAHFFFKPLKTDFLVWSFILIITCFTSLFLHVLSYFKHIKLSNDQIEYIETNCLTQLNEITNDVLQQMP
jgi:hypothetical protein